MKAALKADSSFVRSVLRLGSGAPSDSMQIEP